MAAPRFAPTPVIGPERAYSSPDVVPASWEADRPGDLDGRQPHGERLGYQGPDQGYALRLAASLRPRLVLADTERADDAISGCLGIALKRASIFGRAPVMHDVRMALTMWGFLDQAPPADLVEVRIPTFEGVAIPAHYAERRAIADAVPLDVLRQSPTELDAAYPQQWRQLVGADALAADRPGDHVEPVDHER